MFYVFVVFLCMSLVGDAVEQRAARSPGSNMAILHVASLQDTACCCVSAVSLQALLRLPAVQRQERFRSLALTHCPHGASVDGRWPLLCRFSWPIVRGVTLPLISDSWGEKKTKTCAAPTIPSAGNAVIEGG